MSALGILDLSHSPTHYATEDTIVLRKLSGLKPRLAPDARRKFDALEA